MIQTKLAACLAEEFQNATEVWIAVALLNEEGLNTIEQLLPSNSAKHYLIGIDLPTPLSVLRRLMNKDELNFEAKIYNKPNHDFHPKVYLIKKKTGFSAIVGSANLTNGGLNNNIELSYVIRDQDQCEAIFPPLLVSRPCWCSSPTSSRRSIAQHIHPSAN